MTLGSILTVVIPVGFVLVMVTYVIRMLRRRGGQS
jgi:hypothetical protein